MREARMTGAPPYLKDHYCGAGLVVAGGVGAVVMAASGGGGFGVVTTSESLRVTEYSVFTSWHSNLALFDVVTPIYLVQSPTYVLGQVVLDIWMRGKAEN